MWYLKLKVMVGVAILSIFFGAILRADAESWSKDVVVVNTPSFKETRHFDSDRFRLFSEAGACLIGFGVLTLALAMNQWVSGSLTQPEPAAPGASGKS
jgi:hypothetical protein